jgi:hypothetical protein
MISAATFAEVFQTNLPEVSCDMTGETMASRTLEFVLPDGSLHLLPWAGNRISDYKSRLDYLVNKGRTSPMGYQIFPSVNAGESKSLQHSDDLTSYLSCRLIV